MTNPAVFQPFTLVLTVFLLDSSLWAHRACGRDEPAKLAIQAHSFFKKYCNECHHGKEPKSGVKDYDVLDYASLTKKI